MFEGFNHNPIVTSEVTKSSERIYLLNAALSEASVSESSGVERSGMILPYLVRWFLGLVLWCIGYL